MTLHDLARQWFTSTKFTSYNDMKKRFTQKYSEYGKTPCELSTPYGTPHSKAEHQQGRNHATAQVTQRSEPMLTQYKPLHLYIPHAYL